MQRGRPGSLTRDQETNPGDEERVEGRKRGPEVFGDLTPRWARRSVEQVPACGCD